MQRGEIWWADLPQPSGRRPVLLLSRDGAYPIRNFIIMSPLTTRRRGLNTEVVLGPEEGLSRSSVVNLDVIITERKWCLVERIGSLDLPQLQAVEDAIRFALGMEE
jgi:mRNA interferase MazF